MLFRSQKNLIAVINQDIENLKYTEEKEAYRALKNLIITNSVGAHPSNSNLYVDVMSYWEYELMLGGEKLLLDTSLFWLPGAGIVTSTAFESEKAGESYSTAGAIGLEAFTQALAHMGKDILKEASGLVGPTAIAIDGIRLEQASFTYKEQGTFIGLMSIYNGRYYTSKYVVRPDGTIETIRSDHDPFAYPGTNYGRVQIEYRANDGTTFTQIISLK